MALRERDLADGEEVVLDLRTHAKAILLALLWLVVLVAAVLLVWWFTRDLEQATLIGLVTGAVAAVAAVWLVLVPVLRWNSERYVITTRRIAHRTGILSRRGRDIPLHRVNDISMDKSLLDRVLGCGTLVISDATQQQGMVLRDVPDVERVQVQLHNLLYAADDGSDDGEWPPREPRRGRRR